MKRFVSLDFIKIFAAIITFFFHCNIHLGVPFLWLAPFISQGTIVMDLFLCSPDLPYARCIERRRCRERNCCPFTVSGYWQFILCKH